MNLAVPGQERAAALFADERSFSAKSVDQVGKVKWGIVPDRSYNAPGELKGVGTK